MGLEYDLAEIKTDIKEIKEALSSRPLSTDRTGLYLMVGLTMFSSCYSCFNSCSSTPQPTKIESPSQLNPSNYDNHDIVNELLGLYSSKD